MTNRLPVPFPLPVPGPSPPVAKFDHEKLRVYHMAVDFVILAGAVVQQIPTGHAYLSDQIQRAAASVALNIAEGAGEFSKKEKARFYRMALRSATECAALLDVCARLGLAQDETVNVGRGLLLSTVSMLTKLVRGLLEGEKPGTGRGKGTGRGRPPSPAPRPTGSPAP